MLRKIAEPPPPPCTHPEHKPPTMIVLSPGTYEHECPSCGNKITFVVPRRPRLTNRGRSYTCSSVQDYITSSP